MFFNDRKYIIGAIFILVSIIFIVRLFYIQVLDASYRDSADNNSRRYVIQYPVRGLIYDRHGKLMVDNEAAYDLMFIPQQVAEAKGFDTTELCQILGLTKDQLLDEIKRAKKDRGYSYYKPAAMVKQISARTYAALQEKLYKYEGFYVQTHTVRKYPRPIASHVLGYIGEVDDKMITKNPYYKSGDYVGLSGIEETYEPYLRGKKGMKILLVDVKNRIQGSYKNGKYDTIAVAGANLVSTLDADLQTYGEMLMQNKRGSIVAIEPATGEILVLASMPAYDPNLMIGREKAKTYKRLVNDSMRPLFNRALMAQYPPGSTFKLINALISLSEGTMTTNTHYSCAHGYNLGNFHMDCHHFGSIDFIFSIQGSCNAYYANVYRSFLDNRKFGSVRNAYIVWRKHLISFGIGSKTGSDFANELSGLAPTPEYFDKVKFLGRKDKWKSMQLISMAIGQGEILLTPLQMANMVSAIANRGYFYVPHVVKSIEGMPSIDAKYTTRHYTDIDTQYFRPVIEGMEMVVKGGTAYNVYLPSIPTCGKTGTAQNPHGEDHSIFVAFAPKENPKIAIAVYVENGGFGSIWAAPIASLMIEKYLTDSISRPALEKYILDGNLINNVNATQSKHLAHH